MFSSTDTRDSLEAAVGDTPPLLPTLRTFPLQLSSSSPQALPPSSSDALPSSSVLTCDLRTQNPPTEDEELMRKHEPEKKEKESQKDSLRSAKKKARSKTWRRRAGQSSFTNSIDVTSDSSTIDTTFASEKSTDRPHSTHCHSSTGFTSTSTSQRDRDCASMLDKQEIDNTASISTNSISSIDTHQCHTTSSMIDPEGIEDDIRVLMSHIGAFTRRGLGITHASLKYPDVLDAIHNIARTRPGDFTTNPYMSAQLSEANSLPAHKDKNNLSMTWLIAFGDFTGGRLWLESPLGSHPPLAPQTAWEKNLRGEFHDVKNTWVRFDPPLYHAIEPITSGPRWSLALFTPKNLKQVNKAARRELNPSSFL